VDSRVKGEKVRYENVTSSVTRFESWIDASGQIYSRKLKKEREEWKRAFYLSLLRKRK
jgi:hypothetical protein